MTSLPLSISKKKISECVNAGRKVRKSRAYAFPGREGALDGQAIAHFDLVPTGLLASVRGRHVDRHMIAFR